MKNIHLIPTTQESRLYEGNLEKPVTIQFASAQLKKTLNIYITDHNYEFGEGWYFNNTMNLATFVKNKAITSLKNRYGNSPSHLEKIVITNDNDLIADVVQAIDDDFLEWFVKNPSCEKVEVESNWEFLGDDYRHGGEQTLVYKLIIPVEEPKQEIQFVNGFIPASFFEDEDEDARDYWQKQYKELLNNHKELLLAAEGTMQFLQEQGTFGSALFTAINKAKKIQNKKHNY